MNQPLWLMSPAIETLLNRIVDKLDAANAAGRETVRAIKLDAHTFPHLFKAEFEEEKERLWGHLTVLADWGWVTLKLDRAHPGQAPYQRNPRLTVTDAIRLREATNRPARVRSAGELWREAVSGLLVAPEAVKAVVSRYRLEIPGRTAEEVVGQLNRLSTLADEPLLLREVSARLFWGQSKVLDKRQTLVAALLGGAECPFPEMPVQLQVYLPASGFTGVLFIENLATFEQATREGGGRFAGLALVFASGFKGSARRLRSASGASLYFAQHGTLDPALLAQFVAWLREGSPLRCWFWGDLDYAGMRILTSLRTSFLGLEAWQPGYAPMLSLLEAGQGHTPEGASKTGQLAVAATGCDYADRHLLPALAASGRFIDQETS